jgi:hypothetical protein
MTAGIIVVGRWGAPSAPSKSLPLEPMKRQWRKLKIVLSFEPLIDFFS